MDSVDTADAMELTKDTVSSPASRLHHTGRTPPLLSWRRPVLQFVGMGVVTAVLIALATGWLIQRAANEEALYDAKATTALLGRSVVQPALTEGLLSGRSADVDRFDRLVTDRVIGGDVLRVKIWSAQGTVVYSDEPRLNGRSFPLDDEELDVLNNGGIAAERSDLSNEENLYDQGFDSVVEVYTMVKTRQGTPLLFEVYFSAGDVTKRAGDVLGEFLPISVGGLVLFLLLSVPTVEVLTRRLNTAAADREGLLRAAVVASDVERRRVARDLHDTVVQDLAGTAMALSATSRAAGNAVGGADVQHQLEGLAGAVRGSLRKLRSLLVEIYPPDLYTAGLAAALDDLVAPAQAAGVAVALHTDDTSDLSAETVGLLWRVAQESVRNVLQHARARSLSVQVRRGAAGVALEVSDDGAGFDSRASAEPGHFGLRSLRDLVEMAGGVLDIRSTPGRGTQVRVVLSE